MFIPSGIGYGTECEELATGESCTQTCQPGYSNRSETYSCPDGILTGIPLVCEGK